jgi:hypothetical protein
MEIVVENDLPYGYETPIRKLRDAVNELQRLTVYDAYDRESIIEATKEVEVALLNLMKQKGD